MEPQDVLVCLIQHKNKVESLENSKYSIIAVDDHQINIC